MQPSTPKPSWRDRFNLSRLAIRYPWLTLSFWIAVVVAGILAFSSLKYALFPDITFPVVVVTASAPLETTLETEKGLTQPIETPLQSLDGLDDITASVYPGQTVVNLTFEVGTNLEAVTDEVERALAQQDFPQDTTFKVIPLNLNESAAISYALTSDSQSLETLGTIAQETIVPKIAALPGVLRVDVLGEGSSLGDTEEDNSDSFETNPPTLVRFQGENALAFQVIKRGDANTLEVVDGVEAAVEELQRDLAQVQFQLAATQADYIREATQATIEALFGAIVLAVLVIFPFLRSIRATLITALAIPISLLGTFMVMAIAHFNLETITLLALALTIGIIVDDAIVEVENIARHIEEGKSPRQAALLATDEIGLTVSAATLTIVAVFLPVALMQGTVGQFFKPFGLTVSAAVLTSLLVARTLSPVLAVYWLKGVKGSEFGVKGSEFRVWGSEFGVQSSGFGVKGSEFGVKGSGFASSPSALLNPQASSLDRGYCKLLNWSLHHRRMTLGVAALAFIAGVTLIPFVPKGFIPKLDRGEFNVFYTTPLPELPSVAELAVGEGEFFEGEGFREGIPYDEIPDDAFANYDEYGKGFPGESLPADEFPESVSIDPLQVILEDSREVGEKIESIVRSLPEVESVLTTVGIRGEPNRGKLYLKLKDDRQLDTSQVQGQVRENLPLLDNVTVSVEDIQFVELDSTQPLQIALLGDDDKALAQGAQDLKTRLEELPGYEDVTATGQGSDGEDGVEIQRLNRQRVAYVRANLGEGLALGDATDGVLEIAPEVLPAGVRLQLGGDSEVSSDVFGSFAVTLTLSVTCMLLVLVLPFGRLLEPMVVGLSLPLAIVGAMMALLLTQSDFGMSSLIGFIFLLGLLDKNALLLMDYVNQLRRGGLSRTEAILKTGLVRLRPILMTTASTVLGMIPIALGLGAGAELRQPMAVAIIGGLVTSSLLSLIVVPVLYTSMEDVWGKLVKTIKN